MPNAVDTIIAAFPWMGQIGLQDKLIEWARQGITGDALVGLVRQTEQWKQRFPGIRRPDGTMRMNEASYLQTEDAYRVMLRQWGMPTYRYDNPADFHAFFESEVSPDELQKRFEVYNQVKHDAGPIKDAFYVYAGMKLDDDQWYRYFTDPQFQASTDGEYAKRTTNSPLDYQTWITRATEAGLNRVVDSLRDLEAQGVATGDAISRIQSLDPNFARRITDVLFHGGDPANGKTLSLQELMHGFEYALIGSAAVQNNLELPSLDRVAAIRQAGIDRSAALQRYSAYASQKNLIQGMVDRAGGGKFGQNEFEQAVFLQQASQQELLRRAQAQEEALGIASGSAQFGVQGRRLTQAGLAPR